MASRCRNTANSSVFEGYRRRTSGIISAMNSTASDPQPNAPSYSALAEENALQRKQLDAQAESIRQLKHQLDWFKKQLFGPKSEKQVYDIPEQDSLDRKSTRLNSSHVKISYAVFCLKKKINKT